MKMFQIRVGNMQNFCYIFFDENSQIGFVVDPAFDQKKIIDTIKENGLNISHIVLTHHHHDHINATPALKANTGAEIICHSETAPLLHGDAAYDRLIEDGFSFTIGEEKVYCLHTPGHAPGSLCLNVAERWLVTADTLFIGDCGRADLKGSDPQALFNSLQKIKKLSDNLIVCPGHDYGKLPTQALGEEKRSNPALLAASFAEFMKLP